MKKAMIGLALVALCGCGTTNIFISPAAEPKVGERYELRLRKLKVVQVCDDRVHVMHGSYKGLRICVVPLVNDYVTDSYLRRGVYEYVGPYTFETVKDENGNRFNYTVRLFREVEVNE